jgi:uncharacterized protein
MANIVHFEIGVDDVERGANFYSQVFGWKIERDEESDYWNITTGEEEEPGISGGLVSRFDEWNSTVNTINVPSVDICARKITEAGGRVVAPKIAIPGSGYVQYCEDPEGNAFGIMEYDESAE